jgi:hypothetical protein
VYELVSTSGNFGEPYEPMSPLKTQLLNEVESTSHPFQAAEDGEAVAYVGEPPATGGTGETGPGEGDQWLATRTSEGWKTVVVTPEVGRFESPGKAEYPAYQAFSGDLSSEIFEGPLHPLVAGVPGECRTLYSRAAGGGAYRALYAVSETSPVGGEIGVCGRPMYVGASQDGSQVIFQSEAALTKGAQEAAEVPPGHEAHSETGAETGTPCMFGCSLYEWVGGQLRLVNVLEGKQVPSATFGGYAQGERAFTDFSNAISADGSRIFWTDTLSGSEDFEHVYVQEDGTSTIPVSLGAAEFWTATPDGRYAFYTEGGELWRFDTTPGVSEPRKRLAEGAGSVLGVVGTNQTGEDGAYVYFVAASGGQPDLYVLHGGVTTLIATLSPKDDEIYTGYAANHLGGDWKANLGQRTAEVSPDGRSLVFESVQPLTGYNNIPLNKEPVVEVFVYSADDGQLVCASCSPTGVPPSLSPEASPEETRLPESADSYTYMRRWMSPDGGRVFFDSEQPLVPQDTNGVQDVYEWEREGEGSCTAQAVSPRNHGCVFLLSGGSSQGFSFLVDADVTGENVFFEHEGPLGQMQAPGDRYQLYDARVGGGFIQTSLACVGAACQAGLPPQPSFSSPASVGFAGVGDFPPTTAPGSVRHVTRARSLARSLAGCRRRPRRERAVCERQARRRFGAQGKTSAKRSRRRAGR